MVQLTLAQTIQAPRPWFGTETVHSPHKETGIHKTFDHLPITLII